MYSLSVGSFLKKITCDNKESYVSEENNGQWGGGKGVSRYF